MHSETNESETNENEVTFRLPPATRTARGELRHVGFELEVAGVEIDEAVASVARRFGGSVEVENPYRHRITGSDLGDVTVELDWAVLSESELRKQINDLAPGEWLQELAEKVEKVIADLAGSLVPLEIVTAPIEIERLAVVEDLRDLLRELGAQGTGASIGYAFGLHLNPEVPSPEAGSILRYLRAFLVLHEWLEETGNIDISRRLTPYINPFPKSYAAQVTAASYSPSREQLMDDYYDANPTRNRPLDLLPLFAWLDDERASAHPEQQLVKARPAYHYRMPNCRVEEPQWRIAKEWNRWVVVEELAADEARLEQICEAYQEHVAEPFSFLATPWRERVREWL